VVPTWSSAGRDRLGCPSAAAAGGSRRAVRGYGETESERRSGVACSLASLRTRLYTRLRATDAAARGHGGGTTYGSEFETRSAK